MMLIDSSAPDLQLSLQFVLPIVVGFVAIAALLTRLAVAAQRSPAATGTAGMVGLTGRTLSAVGPGIAGSVAVRGETWRAVADRTIDAGAPIRVTDIRGLTLTVRPE
jgi:membrane-bound serine protease (ClpP class)